MIYYIYREQGYKSLLPLNEESIFENVSQMVVNMNNSTKKMVIWKFPDLLGKLPHNTTFHIYTYHFYPHFQWRVEDTYTLRVRLTNLNLGFRVEGPDKVFGIWNLGF